MIEVGMSGYKWSFTEVGIGHYPDGMPFVKGDFRRVDTMILKTKTLEEFVVGMFIVDALAEKNVKFRYLVIPHMPGGRQDRINPSGDVLFTLKSVAGMINARKFDEVTVFDPHSNVTPALIDRCKVITTVDIFNHLELDLSAYEAVVAPDAGAANRSYNVAREFGLKFLQAEKHRDVATGKLTGFACNGLEAGKRYLIVDDICDGGGTFIGLGQVLLDAGSFADLYVTHGVFSKGTKDLLDVFNVVATTDTTDFDKHSAHVYSVVKDLI